MRKTREGAREEFYRQFRHRPVINSVSKQLAQVRPAAGYPLHRNNGETVCITRASEPCRPCLSETLEIIKV